MLPRRKGTKKLTQVVPSLAVGSHRLRFPAGVYVYFLRWLCTFQHHRIYCLVKQRLFTFVMVDWSGGPLTPGSAITRPTENICGNSTSLKTPQNYSKEGRLKPFFANNVDIPLAGARRLKLCPRKATVRSGKQTRAYVALWHFKSTTKI